jgi:hypothetical protein
MITLRRKNAPTPSAAPDPEPVKRVPSTLNHVMLKKYTYMADYDDYGPPIPAIGVTETMHPEEAVLISSRLVGSKHHAPILDIDFPATLIPSSTPGHHHLYLDTEMSWRTYRRLIKALARAGVIEKSWAKASLRSGDTLLSPPWKKKESPTAAH